MIFLLLFVLLFGTNAVVNQAQYLYWLEYANFETRLDRPHGDSRLWRAPLDNFNDSEILATDPLRQPQAVIVDPTATTTLFNTTTNTSYTIQGQAYFSEAKTLLQSGRIQRWPSTNTSNFANPSIAGGADTVMQSDSSDPQGIGIDLTDIPGWIYFSNAECNNCSQIQRQDVQQHAQRTVTDYGATGRVTSVVVDSHPSGDPSLGAMYFILLDENGTSGSIMGCSLAGCDEWSNYIYNFSDDSRMPSVPVSLALDSMPQALKPYQDEPQTLATFPPTTSTSTEPKEQPTHPTHRLFSFARQQVEDEKGEFRELKLTPQLPKEKKKEAPPPPPPPPAKRLYFAVNTGFVHGVSSAVWRIFTNGTDAEELIGNEFVTSGGMIATAVAVQPSLDDDHTGYLYVAYSRTESVRGSGCIIFRKPLHDIYNDSLRETVVELVNGTKILALAVDNVNVSYTQAPSEEGWGWYIYFLIALGGLFVLALAWMAFWDCVKLYTSRAETTGEGEGVIQSSDGYSPPIYPPSSHHHHHHQQQQQKGAILPSSANSLNQQLISES